MGEKKQREIIEGVTKRLIDEGKIIEAGWVSLKMMAVPEDAPKIQIEEMRNAFFAGAQHLLGSIMSTLDQGDEPTEADLRRLNNIQVELDLFIKDYSLKHSKVEGTA